MTSQVISCVFGLLIVTSLLCLSFSYPQGYGRLGTDGHINECTELHPDVLVLCQRCAKHTRGSNVYPMCCENKEEAREWCERYLGFGQKP